MTRCLCGGEASWSLCNPPNRPAHARWSSVHPGVFCLSCVMRAVAELNALRTRQPWQMVFPELADVRA